MTTQCTEEKIHWILHKSINGAYLEERGGGNFLIVCLPLSTLISKMTKVKVKVVQSCSILCNPKHYSLPGYPWNSLGKNTGVGSRSLLQGIFPTQGLNPIPSRRILYHLSHQGSPRESTFLHISIMLNHFQQGTCYFYGKGEKKERKQ